MHPTLDFPGTHLGVSLGVMRNPSRVAAKSLRNASRHRSNASAAVRSTNAVAASTRSLFHHAREFRVRLSRETEETGLFAVEFARERRGDDVRSFSVREGRREVPDPKRRVERRAKGVGVRGVRDVHRRRGDLPDGVREVVRDARRAAVDGHSKRGSAVVRRPPLDGGDGFGKSETGLRHEIPRRLLRGDGSLVDERAPGAVAPRQRAETIRGVARSRRPRPRGVCLACRTTCPRVSCA